MHNLNQFDGGIEKKRKIQSKHTEILLWKVIYPQFHSVANR